MEFLIFLIVILTIIIIGLWVFYQRKLSDFNDMNMLNKTALEDAPVGILILNSEFKPLYINAHFNITNPLTILNDLQVNNIIFAIQNQQQFIELKIKDTLYCAHILTQSNNLTPHYYVYFVPLIIHKEKESIIAPEIKSDALNILSQGLITELQKPVAHLKELLKKTGKTQEIDSLDQLKKMVSFETEHLHQILSNFEYYAQTDELKFEECNINDLLTKTEMLLKETFDKPNVTIEKVLHILPKTKVDKSKISQVILNILCNAMEAMPQSGGTIEIKTYHTNTHVEIEISNDGIPIPESNRQKIFYPFFSTKPGGVGLGLSISQNIIKKHHGEIQLQVNQNKETHFIIRLPILN